MRMLFIIFALFAYVFANYQPLFSKAVQSNSKYEILLEFSEYETTRMEIPQNAELENCQKYPIFDEDTSKVITNSGMYPYSCKWIDNSSLVISYDESVDSAVSSIGNIVLAGELIKSESGGYASGSITLETRASAATIESAKTLMFGSQIEISFSDVIYMDSSEVTYCSSIFENADILLGKGSICVLGSSITMLVEVKPSATISYITSDDMGSTANCKDGSSLTLLSGVLQPLKDSIHSTEGCINIEDNHTQEAVIELQGPSMVGNCSETIVYTTMIHNSGVADVSYSWSISLESGESNSEVSDGITKIQNIFDEATTNDWTYVSIESGDLIGDRSYRISISVTVGSKSPVIRFIILEVGTKPVPLVLLDFLRVIELIDDEKRRLSITTKPSSCLSAEDDTTELVVEYKCSSDDCDNIDVASMNVLKSNELLLDGSKFEYDKIYTFNVEVAEADSSNISTTEFTVKRIPSSTDDGTNHAPVGGIITSSRSSGVAFKDMFHFEASNWNDEDLPLEFKFVRITQNGSEVPIKQWSTQSYVDTMLKAGHHKIKVYVRDSFGNFSSTDRNLVGDEVYVTVEDIAESDIPSESNRADHLMSLYSIHFAAIASDADQLITLAFDLVTSFDLPCTGVLCDHGSCVPETGICECDDGYTGEHCNVLPSVDGIPSDTWSEWSECSVSCGGGIQIATRECDNPAPQSDGKQCLETDLIKTQACNSQACVETIDGGYSDWIQGECVADCENLMPYGGPLTGTRVLTRTCNNPTPSVDGKECIFIGSDTMEETCTATCERTIPRKACPGDTDEFSNECNGNGQCYRIVGFGSDDYCPMDDPLCYTKCYCSTGFSGRSCLRESSNTIASNVATLLSKISTALPFSFTDGDKLVDNLSMIHEIIGMDRLTSQSDSIVIGMIDDILSHENDLTMDIYEKMISIVDDVLNFQIAETWAVPSGMDTLETLTSRMHKSLLPDEEPITFQMGSMDIALETRQADNLSSSPFQIPTTYGNPVEIHFPENILDGLDIKPSVVHMKSIVWLGNPYRNSVWAMSDMQSNVIRITLADEDDNKLDISSIESPISFSFDVADRVELGNFICSYLHENVNNGWYDSGTTQSGFEIKNAHNHVTCETIHLTDFAVTTPYFNPITPTVNYVDPSEYELLLQYNLSNSTPVIVLGVITFIFSFLCFIAGQSHRSTKEQFVTLQTEQFLKNGRMKPVKDNDVSAFFRVVHHLRRDHIWGSYFAAPMAEQIALTRFQRLATMVAMTYTLIAVNAAFYGQENVGLAQKSAALICSILVVLPSSILFPMMFRKVNDFYSMTLGIIKARKKSIKKVNKGLKKMPEVSDRLRSMRFNKIYDLGAVINVEPEPESEPALIQVANKPQPQPQSPTPVSKSSKNKYAVTPMEAIPVGIHISKPLPIAISTRNNDSFVEPTSPTSPISPSSAVSVMSQAISIDLQSLYAELYKTKQFATFFILTSVIYAFIGFLIVINKLQKTDFGALFIIAQVALMIPLCLNSCFGLWATLKLKGAHMELYALFNWSLALILTFFGVIVALFKEIEVANVVVEYFLEYTWKEFHKDAELNYMLKSTQSEHNCCGWDIYRNYAINPCPKGSTPQCNQYVIDEFQSENIWFVVYAVGLMIILVSCVYFNQKIRKMLKQIQEKLISDIEKGHNAQVAAIRVQALYRGWRARTKTIRLREVEAWKALHYQRLFVACLVYGIVFAYCGFMLYINLLYGVKFSGSIAASWLKSSIICIMLDILLQQPLVIIGKATVEHLLVMFGFS